jgi:hypothetical protein
MVIAGKIGLFVGAACDLMKYPVFAIIEQIWVCRTHDVARSAECEEMNPDLSVE